MALVTRRYKWVCVDLPMLQLELDPTVTLSPLTYTEYIDVTYDDAVADASAVDESMRKFGCVFDSTTFLGPPVLVADIGFKHELVVASVAGKNNYVTPIGDYVWDQAGQSTLEVDTGSGFTPVVFGSGYTHFLRSSTGTPASVNDAAIGFSFIGSVAAGWTFRFRWRETVIQAEPIAIAKVKLPIDYTIVWNSNSTDAPNGVMVPAMTGLQCEFWRQTNKPGGKRGASPVLIRDGRRYIPFYRGATGVFAHPITDFSVGNSTKRQRFKICYYNPLTGARSRLSADTVVVCSGKDDAVNGRIPVRTARSVWIE